jgi:FkbH-like protein
MSHLIYSRLTWLPEAPHDFACRCHSLLLAKAENGQLAQQLRTLSNFRLDDIQLLKLAQTMAKLKKAGCSLSPLVDFTLGLLCNDTPAFLAPALSASAIRHGIALEVLQGDYGQVMQDALSPDSAINAKGVNAVLLSLDYRWYPLHPCPGQSEEAERVVEACVAQIQAVRSAIKLNCGAICIFQTLAPPVEGLFGSLDRALPGTLRYLIDRVNEELGKLVLGSDDVIFDVAGLAEIVGLADWHSPTLWNMAKIPFSHTYLPLYAECASRLLGSLVGTSRRCLILDLDNIVWGGVIGDDGLNGIKIAQGDATGEAHLEVQRMALALRSRGIVLAVCSKNSDEIARRPFQERAEMLLRLDHFAAFRANWMDKASNINAIAEELSLGLESMVFMDDNPMERDLVRQMLPAVAVPELPDDAALYVRTLMAAGYFESVRFVAEDVHRAEFYQNNKQRITHQEQVGNLDDYLDSLNMIITFQPFDAVGRTRIAQLVNKSRQFNLTTPRYSEADIAGFEINPEMFTLQVRLTDNFGDNGMICVLICRHRDLETWEIDTWLMSCRALGRRVENSVLQQVVDCAKARTISRLIGRFVPTGRNGIVEHHYEKLGFHKLEVLSDGTTVWELRVAEAHLRPSTTSFAVGGF